MSKPRDATGAAVYGPARERIPEPLTRLADGDQLAMLGLRFRALDVPGHTASPVTCDCADVDGAAPLFCGETSFSGRCARLFEATPTQMPSSAGKLEAAPGPTRVRRTHEYILGGLKFTGDAEPNNNERVHYLQRCEERRAQDLPPLPSTIEEENRIHPFLRARLSGVAQAARADDGTTRQDDVAVFATLRQRKNEFK